MAIEDHKKMRVPNLDHLLTMVESKFALITIISKRARQLTNGARPLIETGETKAVSIALDEIASGVIKYKKIPGKGDRDGY